MQTYMRNKVTSEIRDVEQDSEEFRELQKEVTPNGLPMWEQTSHPHAEAIRDRAAHDELLPEDLGEDHQNDLRFAALQLDAEGVAPEKNPHLALSPGEVEAGLTPHSKLDDLKQQYEAFSAKARHAIFGDAADVIAGDRERGDRRGLDHLQAGDGMSARAGGSDTRVNAPTVDASTQKSPQRNGSEDGADSDSGDSSGKKDRTPAGVGAGNSDPNAQGTEGS